jgi:outer membrane protein assembly factor BamB
VLCGLLAMAGAAFAGDSALPSDWPAWRGGPERRGVTAAPLSPPLYLQWVRKLPPQQPAWTDDDRAKFDRGYHPVAGGGMLFVASTINDRVTAYDLATGVEKWAFYAEGPIRVAPALWRTPTPQLAPGQTPPPNAGKGFLYVASDDGWLYCLSAETGAVAWKRRPCPQRRLLVGNRRVISTWPCRGGPAVAASLTRAGQTDVYVAAGVFPFMGAYVAAYDAETGRNVWTGTDGSFPFRSVPHPGAFSFSGLSPQGHIAVAGDKLIIPGGIDAPGIFDRRTGRFLRFGAGETHSVMAAGNFGFCGGRMFALDTGREVRLEGARVGPAVLGGKAWYVSGAVLDPDSLRIGAEQITTAANSEEISRSFRATADVRRDRGIGTPWLLAGGAGGAKAHLVVTGGARGAPGVTTLAMLDVTDPSADAVSVWQGDVTGAVSDVLAAAGRLIAVTLEGSICCFGAEKVAGRTFEAPSLAEATPAPGKAMAGGYSVVIGGGEAGELEKSAREGVVHVVGVEPDAGRLERLRRKLDEAGLYGTRAAMIAGRLDADLDFPPYFAEQVLVPDLDAAGFTPATGKAFAERLFRMLRPYGGAARVECGGNREAFATAAKTDGLAGANLAWSGQTMLLTRQGALSGSAEWLGQNADAGNTRCSRDDLVKAPLGLLWFGNAMPNSLVLPRHGEGPVEQVAAGRLVIEGPDSLSAADVYTGRLLWTRDMTGLGMYYNVSKHQRGAHALGSNYFAAGDEVYVAREKSCLVLDARSGGSLRELKLPGGAGWMFMIACGDKLVAGMDPDVVDVRGRYNTDATSKGLAVLDRRGSSVLWTRQADRGFGHYAVAAGAGKVFCFDRLSADAAERLRRRGIDPNTTGTTLLALDIKTGEVVWQSDRCVGDGRGLSYSEEHDIVLAAGALRGKDGKVLWDRLTIKDAPDPCSLGPGFADSVRGGVERLWWGKWGPMINGRTIYTQGQAAFDLLTGEQKIWTEPNGTTRAWRYRRSHGCGPSAGARHVITFRSGCAGFYDLARDGGTANLGGFRSGCTSNLIVACGVLNAPDYTRSCGCAYQNRTSLGMVHDAEAEYWTYGATPTIGRVGFNFAAPGDRVDDDGTLWRAEPPAVPARFGGLARATISPAPDPNTEGGSRTFYNHSLLLTGPARWRWVGGSGLIGARSVTVPLAELRGGKPVTIRLVFVEPEHASTGKRVLSVGIAAPGMGAAGAVAGGPGGKPAIENLDVFGEAGARMLPVVKELRDVRLPAGAKALEFTLTSKLGETLLCGVEIVEP